MALSRFKLIVMAIGGMVYGIPAMAAETYCAPAEAALFCSLRSETTLLTQNDIDTVSSQVTSDAWVIGGTTTISLPAGTQWQPGPSNFNSEPTIWVIGNGVLEIVGTGASEVGIDAAIYLCDNATLRVKDSAFRSQQDFSYQHWLWAADNSKVEYENAEVITSDSGGSVAFFQAMRGSSTLSNTMAGPATFSTSGGKMDLAVLDSAQANIENSDVLVESYVAGSSSLSITNSEHIGMSLTSCATDNLTLANVPVACDLGTQCFTAGHPLTDFTKAPSPAINIDDTKIWAWTVETFPNSTTNLQNIPVDANLAVALAGEMNGLTLTLAPFAVPLGITDRTFTFNSAEVSFWNIWPNGASNISLQPGSNIASVITSGTSVVSATDAHFESGEFTVRPGTQVHLRDSVVRQAVLNEGTLTAIGTNFEQALQVIGSAWLADSSYDVNPVISANGELFEVALNFPDGSNLPQGQIATIMGSVNATDDSGEISPFPEAKLDLWNPATMTATSLATITASGTDVTLGSVDSSAFSPGQYELRLYFSNSPATRAVRSLNIVVGDFIFSDEFE